jgi:hypothetical protein
MGVHPTTEFINRVWDAHERPDNEEQHAFLAFFDDDHVFTENRVVRGQAKTRKLLPPHGGVDLYFAPCLFRRKRRRNEYALPGRWLYADLDESDPRKLNHLPPTVAWETSRGRYQCLWRLTEALPPEKLAFLNQRTTYFTDADRGGWSLTKVLRVPGSISTKHGDDFQVRLMWWKDELQYDPKDIHTLVRGMRVPKQHYLELRDVKFPKAPPGRIVRRFRIPPRAKKLLRATEARGDRSERLWCLYVDLLSAGMKPEQVFVVVRPTVWNKYRGQKREIPQLWSEINKAAAQTVSDSLKSKSRRSSKRPAQSSRRGSKQQDEPSKSSKTSPSKSKKRKRKPETENGLPDFELDSKLQTFGQFMSKKIRKPGWMVEAIWAEGAHGILTGEAKAFKSVISTDLAISVASGSPFLNSFSIPSVGPVLIIQEENDEGEFQDRIHRIIESRGLGASASFSNGGGTLQFKPTADLPIHTLSNAGFDLTRTDHLEWLQKQVVKHQLALVILDPFYLMTPGVNENEQAQVAPVLKKLLRLKQAHGVGIQIIHHYKKQNVLAPIHGAARMSGSSVFHRWFESAVYVEKTEDPTTVRLIPDHRGQAPQGAMRVSFDLGTPDDSEYNVYVHQAKADRAMLHSRLREIMKDNPDGLPISQLRVQMGMASSKPLKQMARDQGLIVEKRKTGLRGRPQIIVRPMTEQGQKSRDTQYRGKGKRGLDG